MQIRSKGWDGEYVLVNAANQPINNGDKFTLRDGELVQLHGGNAPHKPESTGRVYVGRLEGEGDMSYFPNVIGCKWVKVKGEGQ